MRDAIVTYQPIGRLGNQMFQLAAAIGYAKKHDAHWTTPHDTKEVPKFHTFFPGLPKYDGNELRRFNAADPSQFNYSPIPFHPLGLKLVGFFQSEKFFEGAHDKVKATFKLNINPVDAVSIHVRRGDYVQHPNSFPPVTVEYLLLACEMMRLKGHSKFLVFSDEIEWCKVNLDGKYDCTFSEGRTELEDLSMMASCSHHIIANSTFSWWGAWLGHNPDKIIISPHYENWFGPGFSGSPPIDLIPSTWHQIKFR